MPGNKKIEQLLSQPMNRREFLRNVGLLLISLIGLSRAIHILSSGHINKQSENSSQGFGQGRYGP